VSQGLLIHNPKAGSHKAEVIPQLVAALGDVEAIAFEEIGDLKKLPALARERGCTWVAAAGGDGTIEAIASVLIGTDLTLGVIASGTYNNFARSLHLPLDPLEACKVITEGQVLPIDVAFANGRPFFESLGSGLDAALYPVSEDIKAGRLSRLFDFFHRAYHFKPQPFTLTLDRPVHEALVHGHVNESHHLFRHMRSIKRNEVRMKALMLTVSNGPYFGMNFAIAPQERMDDGLLTVTVFSRYSKLQLWWHFVSIAFGRRDYRPKSIAFRVASLQVGGSQPLPVHLDGTPQDNLWPLQIECRKAALNVFRRR
jgi:diacylglycerol kinase (ATP)